MYYFNPFEAHAAVEQYERTVAENLVACEAMRETNGQSAITQTPRTWRTNWLARRMPLGHFSFHRHA